jgi:hypothetical protein
MLGAYKDGAWHEFATGKSWTRSRAYVSPDEVHGLVDTGTRWLLDLEGVIDPEIIRSGLPRNMLNERDLRLLKQGKRLRSGYRYVAEEWTNGEGNVLLFVVETPQPRTERELKNTSW